ncbi:MAG: hypothetical protein IJS54_02625 [Desulfovibrio sp.]|nr:hypothetical protein [Desulfovibrio sp.]
MSLTEVLLSLAIMIGVIAGVAVNYANVKERNEEQQVMQGIEMLRANIEQIYGHNSYTDISNTLLVESGAVPHSLLKGDTMTSPWGTITVSAPSSTTYSIALENLPVAACRTLASLSTTSWKSVSVDDTVLFDRTERSVVNPSSILTACNGDSRSVTFVGP